MKAEEPCSTKYRKAADLLHGFLLRQPRTAEGSWWHKQIYPDQVWLDWLYMAQPFSALYEKHFGAGDYSDLLRQFAEPLVKDNTIKPYADLVRKKYGEY